MRSPWARRMITIPAVFVGWVVVTATLPLLLVAAAGIDFVRRFARRLPATTLRVVVFGWFYLFVEAVTILALAGIWVVALPLGRERLVDWTYALAGGWARIVLDAACRVLGLRIEVEGDEVSAPGPVLVFSRHASIIDTLLGPVYILRRHGIRLRFVMKRELLVVPTLDIAGNRLPNYFVERHAADKGPEIEGVRALARDLGPSDGVLIYPEGTRYTSEKHARALAHLAAGHATTFRCARRARHVLPPHIAGPLALVDEAPHADVCFLVHEGLSGFAHVADIWRKGLAGRTLRLWMWRVPHHRIPTDPEARARWLYDQWERVDAWIDTQLTTEEESELQPKVPPDLLETGRGRFGSWRRA